MTPIIRTPAPSRRSVTFLLAVCISGAGLAGAVLAEHARLERRATAGRVGSSTGERHSVDVALVAGHRYLLTRGLGTLAVPRRAALVISGWAVDTVLGRPAAEIEARVAGRRYRAPVDRERPDVAAALADPAYRRSGFFLRFPPRTFHAGRVTMTFAALGASRTARYDLHRTLTLNVHDP